MNRDESPEPPKLVVVQREATLKVTWDGRWIAVPTERQSAAQRPRRSRWRRLLDWLWSV